MAPPSRGQSLECYVLLNVWILNEFVRPNKIAKYVISYGYLQAVVILQSCFRLALILMIRVGSRDLFQIVIIDLYNGDCLFHDKVFCNGKNPRQRLTPSMLFGVTKQYYLYSA